jgi:signal transduction histidine kinase
MHGDSEFVELLRKMAHDIRAPLGAVISTSDMLADGVYEPLTPRQARANERVQRNGRRALAILDDFVTYMKADADQLDLTPTVFEPRVSLSDWCAPIQTAAEAKGLAFHLTTQETVPAYLQGDASAISRIVTALAWNAVAFTAQGSISIDSAWTSDDQWLLRVKDTGIGIPAENAPHIFEPFWRGEDRPQVPTASIGIGLALSSALVKLMGGKLLLTQTDSTGSTFSLFLPLKTGSQDDERIAKQRL